MSELINGKKMHAQAMITKPHQDKGRKKEPRIIAPFGFNISMMLSQENGRAVIGLTIQEEKDSLPTVYIIAPESADEMLSGLYDALMAADTHNKAQTVEDGDDQQPV